MRKELYTLPIPGCNLIVSRIDKNPFTARNAITSGFITCEYRAFKVPTKNRVRIDLFTNISIQSQWAALQFGISLASGNEHLYLPWKKQAFKDGSGDFFWATLGKPIDFEERFQQVTADLEMETFTDLVEGISS